MSNLYKRLVKLMPQSPLQIGTVSGIQGTDVQLTLPDGKVIRVRGQATVGSKVFFRNNVIEAAAPNLNIQVIEV